MDAAIRDYIKALNENLAKGTAGEHTHRPALKTFIEAAFNDVHAVNEPKRIECGSPDLQIVKKGASPLTVGYIEAKDIHVDLKAIDHDSGLRNPKTPNGQQLKRYREGLPNLILTNYLDLYWYVDGERRLDACLAQVSAGMYKASLELAPRELLNGFMSHSLMPIARPDDLAQRMAGLARLIRESIQDSFNSDEPPADLQELYEASEQALDPELKLDDFIDMFTQTLAYGLFAARVNHDETDRFDRQKAAYEIPSPNPFIQKMFHLIVGPQLNNTPFVHYVDDLTRLLNNVDMHALLADFGRGTGLQDPIMHFYETFLDAYDPALRRQRGVYYTPSAVIGYIVRSVNILLKERFGCIDGLADPSKIRRPADSHRVLILDPACGTGSFLYAVVNHIRDHFETSGRAGMWKNYVKEHLLPRLFGFELLTAPYAMAHLRLWMQLSALDKAPDQRGAWEYEFAPNERIGVYLTNSLHKAEALQKPIGFLGVLTDEANAAVNIKSELPVMVVLGNPPYAGHSANKGAWIREKIDDYKKINGESIHERNIKWLSDDYVKFIRFGQWRIEETGSGILAFITNHGYIDNVTFRGMRKSLLETFDEIYLLDLHGNARKGEQAPDGGPDENVFNIQQGVAIGIFVKNERKDGEKKALASVYHADLWGIRDEKYKALNETDLRGTDWTTVAIKAPQYYFKHNGDVKLEAEWLEWPKINDIMPVNSVGIRTARDKLTIHFEKENLINTIREFAALSPEEARARFHLRPDSRDWKIELAQTDLNESQHSNENVVPILYRPFDNRWTYYTGKSRGFHCMPRPQVMRHMRRAETIGLLFVRQVTSKVGYTHFGATRYIVEGGALGNDMASVAPLYLQPGDAPKSSLPDLGLLKPNLDAAFIETLEAALRLRFAPDGPGDLEETFGPEDVFHYIYAVFHSPTYRSRYDAFLRIDFPRVPPISDVGLFRRLVELGRELTQAHLLESAAVQNFRLKFPEAGENIVEKSHPKYVEPGASSGLEAGRVYINSGASTLTEPRGGQYFEGVSPAVWEFQLGGYQPMQKWLKDRQGRALSFDDQTHYMRMAGALAETLRLAPLIDEAVGESADLFATA